MAERVTNPAMTRHVEREWRGAERLSDLIEAAEAVEVMRATPGWDALIRVVEREIRLISTGLERGMATDHAAEYAKQHGRLGGLRSVMEAAEAIVERAEVRRRQAEDAQAARAVREHDEAVESVSERKAA
jgi:hypothetical protein